MIWKRIRPEYELRLLNVRVPGQNESIVTPKVRKQTYLPSLLIKSLMILVIIDFSGDPLIKYSGFHLPVVETTIRSAIIALILVGALSSLFCLRELVWSKKALLVFLVIICVFLYGAVRGLLVSGSELAVREMMVVAPILMVPMMMNMRREQLDDLTAFFANAIVVILLFKIVISGVIHFFEFGSNSWKIFLRASPLLLFSFIFFSYKSVVNKKGSLLSVVFATLSLFGILIAQARTLNIMLGLAVILLLFLLPKVYIKFVKLGLFFLIGLGLISLYFDPLNISIYGQWSGEYFDESASYRLEQFSVLMERLSNNPIIGVGFGFVTIGYSGYEDMLLPYLLELDLVNFVTKVGLPVFFIYACSYLVLFITGIAKILIFDDGAGMIVYTFIIPLLLMYSIFQTFHSGILYWIVYSLGFSYIFLLDKVRERPRENLALYSTANHQPVSQ